MQLKEVYLIEPTAAQGNERRQQRKGLLQRLRWGVVLDVWRKGSGHGKQETFRAWTNYLAGNYPPRGNIDRFNR